MSAVDVRGDKRKSFAQGQSKVATGVGQDTSALLATQKDFEEPFYVVISGNSDRLWLGEHLLVQSPQPPCSRDRGEASEGIDHWFVREAFEHLGVGVDAKKRDRGVKMPAPVGGGGKPSANDQKSGPDSREYVFGDLDELCFPKGECCPVCAPVGEVGIVRGVGAIEAGADLVAPKGCDKEG